MQANSTGGENTDKAAASDSTAPLNVQPAAPQENDQPKPQINITSSSSPSTSSENPFAQLGVRQASGGAPKINITSSTGRPATPKKRERPPSSSGRSNSRARETLEQWEDRVLGNLFRITLWEEHQHDAHGNHLQLLGATRLDLEESGQSARLSVGMLDQALLEAASKLKKDVTPLDFLLGCWKRVSKQFKPLKKAGEEDPKFIIVKEARRLCMSYCIFAITMPEMFGWVHSILASASYSTDHRSVVRLRHLAPSRQISW